MVYCSVGGGLGTSTTDVDGNYSLSVSPGMLSFFPIKTGYTFEPAIQTITYSSDNTTLSPFVGRYLGADYYYIWGWVFDVASTSTTISGVTATLTDNGKNLSMITEKLGVFIFSGISPGDYHLSFSRTGYTDYAGQYRDIKITNQNANLYGVGIQKNDNTVSYTVTGRVLNTADGQPIAGATLTLHGPQTNLDAATDANGQSDVIYGITITTHSEGETI